MELNDYHVAALRTASYPDNGEGYISGYPLIKLAGEVGELMEKIGKKQHAEMRMNISVHMLTEEERQLHLKELGDILWNLVAEIDEYGSTLEEVAIMNLTKLADRHARGMIQGAGDDR